MTQRADERFRFITGPFRDGAPQVHIYNEGALVFFYDKSHLERILEVHPTVLDYLDDEVLGERALQTLMNEGSLAILDLRGDGGFDAEVLVGSGPTVEEKRGGRWLEPESTWIALPTGRLRIETYNTAPFSDGSEDWDGAGIAVAPGFYRLTVHEKDTWSDEYEDLVDEAADAGFDVYSDERIDHLVVLEPLPDDGDRPPARVLLGGQA